MLRKPVWRHTRRQSLKKTTIKELRGKIKGQEKLSEEEGDIAKACVEAYKETITKQEDSFVVTLLKVARRICPCFWAMKVALERLLVSRDLVENLRFISLRILLLADAAMRRVLMSLWLRSLPSLCELTTSTTFSDLH
jgi:hypothetical protein